jgi:hypothetical protein
MKRMLIQESERNEILSMHSVIKEQTETPKATGELSPELKVLRKAIKAGCLKNGKILSNKDLTKYIYRATTKSGKQVDFSADMTYKFSDGVGGKWKCDKMDQISAAEITTTADNNSKVNSLKKQGWKTKDELVGVDLNTIDQVYDKQTIGDVVLYKIRGNVNDLTLDTGTSGFNQDQRAFIDEYTGKGYELNPSRVQRTKMVPVTAKDLGAPDDLFPNGLTLYYDPNKQHGIEGKDQTVLGGVLANQSVDRQACRKNVEDYFNSFKQKYSVVVDNPTIYKAKRIVQACKDQYYPNKWGILGGGNKLNNYLEILSGVKEGGPTSYGDDSMWRLK